MNENVKSVQGNKGAAERGFNATYADCIHRICEQVPEELRPWQTKVCFFNHVIIKIFCLYIFIKINLSELEGINLPYF